MTLRTNAATWMPLAVTLSMLVAAGCGSTESSSGGGGAGGGAAGGSVAAGGAGGTGGAGDAAAAPVANLAPAFMLHDVSGAAHSLADYRGKWVVLEWVNPGCPFVRKHYDSKNMQTLQANYTGKGVAWLAICSSAPGKQGYDEAAGWTDRIRREGWSTTAVLVDADGTVGRLYEAKTTPHMFVIDPKGSIVYRGAIDDKRSTDQREIATARNFVAEVLDAALAGKPAPVAETPPYGCSVKY